MKSGRRIPFPYVAIAEGRDPAAAVRSALQQLDLSGLVTQRDTVLVTASGAELPARASARYVAARSGVLEAVLLALQSLAPRRLLVGVSKAPAASSAELHGMGAEVVDLNSGPFVEVSTGYRRVPALMVNRAFVDADVLAVAAPLLLSDEPAISLAMEGLALSLPPAEVYGAPGGPHPVWRAIRADLDSYIVAVGALLPIDLTVIDVHDVAAGTRPTLAEQIETDLAVAGTDPLATEAAAVRLLGFHPEDIRYLREAAVRGLGELRPDATTYPGLSLSEAQDRARRRLLGQRP